jgi:MinD superfamily P-loop ATPase
MIVRRASGKGGTGKTTIATSLAISLAAELKPPPLFLDCDVEAPHAHLFLQPVFTEQKGVGMLIPFIDEQHCNYCAKCAEICRYDAVAVVGKKTMIFSQLCHSCGSCMASCPEKAIGEVHNRIGVSVYGQVESKLTLARGVVDVGEPMAVPVIRQLKKWAFSLPGQAIIRDAPPGGSCPIVEAVRGNDYLLLVAEPTPFGLHDLHLAVQMAEEPGIRAGMIVKRENGPYPALETFGAEHHLPVLLRMPFERAVAEGIAQGIILVEVHPDFRILLFCMVMKIACSSRKACITMFTCEIIVIFTTWLN